jgi:hypothetical protein
MPYLKKKEQGTFDVVEGEEEVVERHHPAQLCLFSRRGLSYGTK